METETQRVREILDAKFETHVYSVEDGVVWVSGMNSGCMGVARSMAKHLVHTHDIPASLVYDDNAAAFGGVQFNWGEAA